MLQQDEQQKEKSVVVNNDEIGGGVVVDTGAVPAGAGADATKTMTQPTTTTKTKTKTQTTKTTPAKTIAEKTREEFESSSRRIEYSSFFDKKAPPIILQNLTIMKDGGGTGTGSGISGGTSSSTIDKDNEVYSSQSLEMAPNFLTAVLGQWMATKLGCGTPPPPPPSTSSSSSSSSSSQQQQQVQRHVLHNINALLLPGEGTLLLGPSSSGKSTLMKTIRTACENGGYYSCYDYDGGKGNGRGRRGGGGGRGGNGSSSSSPKDSSPTMMIRILHDDDDDDYDNGDNENYQNIQKKQKKYPRSAAYSDQGDLSLTPTLTVKETIEFARRCAEGFEKTTSESVQKIFELVGLDHVQQTVVGNADIRGVSGGQKRRVKVLEQAVGDQVVCLLLDEITNGLDAASAYQVCQVVRTRYVLWDVSLSLSLCVCVCVCLGVLYLFICLIPV